MSTFTVAPNAMSGSGFNVVELTPDGHHIVRGWTYPSREQAERALPLVRAGNYYPTAAQLNGAAGRKKP